MYSIAAISDKWTKIASNARFKKQRGMTLLELIVVLGILGSVAAARQAYERRDAIKITHDIRMISEGIRTIWGKAGNLFPRVDPNTINSYSPSEIISVFNSSNPAFSSMPARLIQSGVVSVNDMTNPASNELYIINGVKSTSSSSSKLDSFYIEINGLTNGLCYAVLREIYNEWSYIAVVNATSRSFHYSSLNYLSTDILPPATSPPYVVIKYLNSKNSNDIIDYCRRSGDYINVIVADSYSQGFRY